METQCSPAAAARAETAAREEAVNNLEEGEAGVVTAEWAATVAIIPELAMAATAAMETVPATEPMVVTVAMEATEATEAMAETPWAAESSWLPVR